MVAGKFCSKSLRQYFTGVVVTSYRDCEIGWAGEIVPWFTSELSPENLRIPCSARALPLEMHWQSIAAAVRRAFF